MDLNTAIALITLFITLLGVLYMRRDLSVADQPDPLPQSANIDTQSIPTPSTHLIGREAELQALATALHDSKTKLFHLHAPGGEGKSALLYYWLKQLEQREWDGVAKVFAWSFDPTQADAGAFLRAALAFFGREAPKKEEAMAKALLIALQPQPTILILDNLEPFQSAVDVNGGRLHGAGLQALFAGLKGPLMLKKPFLVVSVSRQKLKELERWPQAEFQQQRLEPLSTPESAALLRQLNVRGKDEEIQKVCAAWSGHALSLVLLGKGLARAHRGELARLGELDVADLTRPDPESETKEAESTENPHRPGEHARRLVGFYLEHYWFGKAADDPGAVFMALLGLFDHNPSVREMDRALSGHHGFAWRQLELGQKNKVIQKLEAAGLLLPNFTHPRQAWASHPLIRQAFGAYFREHHPQNYRQANESLFRFYLRVPKMEFPDSLEKLEPLYRAMRHGCAAGEFARVLKVYLERIVRWEDQDQGKLEGYSLFQLGAYAPELAALHAFYPQGWQVPPPGLAEQEHGWLLSQAAACLMSLGRLAESLAPREAGLAIFLQQQDWFNASMSAQNLVDTFLPLGRLAEAKTMAQRALDYAERIERAEDKWLRCRNSHAYLATCLHRLGEWDAARTAFSAAEQLQAKHDTETPWLYSLPGAWYGAFLLEVAAKDAPAPAASRAAAAASEASTRAVLRWGEAALAISERNQHLLGIALGHLTLARAHHQLGQTEDARRAYRTAEDRIRVAGSMNHFPQFLLAHADFLIEQGEPETAGAKLAEAREVSERGGMRLYLADYVFLRARWEEAAHPGSGQEYHQEGARLADAMGYVSRFREPA